MTKIEKILDYLSSIELEMEISQTGRLTIEGFMGKMGFYRDMVGGNG